MVECVRHGVSVENAAAVGANVDPPVDARVAGDLQDQSPLVLVVIDAHPGVAFVAGAKDAGLAIDGTDKEQRRINMSWSRLAESESMNFCDARQMRERQILVIGECLWWGVIKAIESGEPKIAGVSRGGVQTILATAPLMRTERFAK